MPTRFFPTFLQMNGIINAAFLFTAALLFAPLFIACDTDPASVDNGNGHIVTDADGNIYGTVRIGSQIWTTENLRTTRYNDGTAIPHVLDDEQWISLETPAYCWYNNNTDTSEHRKWGALYNGYAAISALIAPAGWRVPTDTDWSVLENYLIANGYNWDGSLSGNKIGKALASKTDWASSDSAGTVGNDTASNNSSGFTGLPAGTRYFGGHLFVQSGYNGVWWSATAFSDTSSSVWVRSLSHQSESLHRHGSSIIHGFPVRLVRDAD